MSIQSNPWYAPSKDAQQNIKKLFDGEKSHHSSPKIVQMKLPSENLAENDKEKVIIFASYFSKLLNDNKPTNENVIQSIKLREFMLEQDNPPSWEELILAVI